MTEATARGVLAEAIRQAWHSQDMADECWIDYEIVVQYLAARGYTLSAQPEADEDTLADIQQAATGGPDFTVATWPQPEASGETETCPTCWQPVPVPQRGDHDYGIPLRTPQPEAAPALPEPGERP